MIFYQLHLAPTSDDISLRVRIQRNTCMGLHGERLTRERLTNTIIKITKKEKNNNNDSNYNDNKWRDIVEMSVGEVVGRFHIIQYPWAYILASVSDRQAAGYTLYIHEYYGRIKCLCNL